MRKEHYVEVGLGEVSQISETMKLYTRLVTILQVAQRDLEEHSKRAQAVDDVEIEKTLKYVDAERIGYVGGVLCLVREGLEIALYGLRTCILGQAAEKLLREKIEAEGEHQ